MKEGMEGGVRKKKVWRKFDVAMLHRPPPVYATVDYHLETIKSKDPVNML